MRQTPRQRAAQARLDEEHRQASAIVREFATHYFRLHEACRRPACRRAQACVGSDELPPCILEHRRHYEHLLPELREALMARADEGDVAGEADDEA